MRKPKETLDEFGRKFYLARTSIRFFGFVIAAAFAQSAIPGLEDLNLTIIAGAAGGVGALVAVYSGANAWAKQAEARIYESTTTRVQDLDLADE
jgi:hypothetical protein